MGWRRVLPVNLATGRAYRGVNTVVLWASGQARSYGSAVWGTYRQWQERGAQVRKGEQASPVVFWKAMDRSGAEAGSEEQEEARGSRRFVARGYSVFNADQVDGYRATGAPVLAARDAADRAGRDVLRRGWCGCPAWRQPGVLPAGAGLHPDAAVRGVRGRAVVLRGAGA